VLIGCGWLGAYDLLIDMEAHSTSGDFSSRVFAEPHTEIGKIAQKYNEILDKVEHESDIAQRAVEQAHNHINVLRLISDVSKYINISETIDDALNFTLKRIYECTGWAFGHVFVFDKDKQLLVSSQLHYSSDEERFKDFFHETAQLEVIDDPGIIGRVYTSGDPVWLSNVTSDPYFLRKARAAEVGLNTVLAFPIMSGDKIVAVFELYSREILKSDASLLGAMSEIGVQLGRSFERNSAQIEQERIERELNMAQKLESVGRLAAGVAHEINTPVQYVSDNTQFLDDAFNDLFELQKVQTKLLNVVRESNVDPDLIAAVDEESEKADIDYLMDEIPKAISQALEGTARITQNCGCDETVFSS